MWPFNKNRERDNQLPNNPESPYRSTTVELPSKTTTSNEKEMASPGAWSKVKNPFCIVVVVLVLLTVITAIFGSLYGPMGQATTLSSDLPRALPFDSPNVTEPKRDMPTTYRPPQSPGRSTVTQPPTSTAKPDITLPLKPIADPAVTQSPKRTLHPAIDPKPEINVRDDAILKVYPIEFGDFENDIVLYETVPSKVARPDMCTPRGSSLLFDYQQLDGTFLKNLYAAIISKVGANSTLLIPTGLYYDLPPAGHGEATYRRYDNHEKVVGLNLKHGLPLDDKENRWCHNDATYLQMLANSKRDPEQPSSSDSFDVLIRVSPHQKRNVCLALLHRDPVSDPYGYTSVICHKKKETGKNGAVESNLHRFDKPTTADGGVRILSSVKLDDTETDFFFYKIAPSKVAFPDVCNPRGSSLLFAYRSLDSKFLDDLDIAIRNKVHANLPLSIPTGIYLDLPAIGHGSPTYRRYDNHEELGALYEGWCDYKAFQAIVADATRDLEQPVPRSNSLDVVIEVSPNRRACLALRLHDANDPSGYTDFICRKEKDTIESTKYARVSTGHSLDLNIHHRITTTYDGMLKLCNKSGTKPWETLMRQLRAPLPATIGRQIKKSNIFANTSGEVLLWTGAKFNVLSEHPYAMELPDNQRRTSLDMLEWCPDSRNYRNVINEQMEKLRLNAKKNRDSTLTPNDSLYVTLKYSSAAVHGTCLHLYDGDIGLLHSETHSRLVPVCETQPNVALRGGVDRIDYTDRDYVLFFNTRDKVTFENAFKACKRVGPTYALAGSRLADPTFLKHTFQAVRKFDSPYVWLGGFFNLTSTDKFLGRWMDGSVTDLSKSSSDIWCRDPRIIIEREIQNLKAANSMDQTFDLVIPIVLSKHTSSCLTLYTDDLLWPNRSVFPPLCLAPQGNTVIRNVS